jgi:signal transduction histidine kinase
LVVLVLALTQIWQRQPVLAVAAGICALALACIARVLAVSRARALADAAAQRAELLAVYARTADERLSMHRKLARDLHDGMQPELLAIAASLEAAKVRVSDEDSKKVLRQARVNTLQALQELRDYTSGLYPTVLDAMGLGEAIQQLADKLPVPVDVHVADDRFPPRIEYGLYLVVSEALANIVKHANAASATVGISIAGDIILAEIADDGVGGADPQGGGLTGLKQRIAELGGRMTMTSSPGQGTTIRARIPCE